MTLRTAQEVLSILTAPALVCASNGSVIASNAAAIDWLDAGGSTTDGQSLAELLDLPGESLAAFTRRSLGQGHAACKGPVFRRGSRSRESAMSCHAQRLRGILQHDCLLLIFASIATSIATRITPTSAPSRRSANAVSSPTIRIEAVSGRLRAEEMPVAGMPDLSDMALALVHEARQPLTAISLYAQTCRRRLRAGRHDDPGLLATMDKIIEQADSTGRMIGSLKGLAHGHDDGRQPCDLSQLVCESLDLLALDPRCEQCAISSQLPPDGCPVNVSPLQIQLVLLNLLRNALDACLAVEGHPPRVRVAVRTEAHWARATVSDTGAGVTAPADAQWFEPSESGKPDGLGLGLAICDRLATAHEGRIEYRQGTRGGASFHLLLPLAS